MLETSEQIPDPVLEETTNSKTPEADNSSQDEGALTAEIVQLWQVHGDWQRSIKHETEQFRAIRSELGKLLHQVKELLARPGRNGQWCSWLKDREIPRATADRLVQKYVRSLRPPANCLIESISEPTEEEIEKAFFKVLPKLRRVLRTPQGFYRFVDLLTLSFDGIGRRVTEEGILIVKPSENAKSENCPAGEIVAGPQAGITDPEGLLDSELM